MDNQAYRKPGPFEALRLDYDNLMTGNYAPITQEQNGRQLEIEIRQKMDRPTARLCDAAPGMLHQLRRVVEAIDAGKEIRAGSQMDGKIRALLADFEPER